MMKLLLSMMIMVGCGIGIGIGTFFFGKVASRERCGGIPDRDESQNCPSQKAGLCPVEDTSGAVKLANRSRVSYYFKA